MTEKPVWNVKSETVLTTVDTGVMVNISLPVVNPSVNLTAPYPPSAAPVEILFTTVIGFMPLTLLLTSSQLNASINVA